MIRKKGAVFWLDIWVGKKRVRRSLRTTERIVAIERARDVTAELRKPKAPGTSFGPFSAKYLEWAKTVKPAYSRTERYYIGVIRLWLEREGLLALEQISPHAVERLRAHLLTRPIGKTARTMSRATANRYCALLRTIFNKAKDWGDFAGDNPVSRVKFYREGSKVRPLAQAEIRAILAATDTLAARKYATPLQREAPALFRFILNTGLRRSEALGLRWRDYTGSEISIVGKQERRRTVPLNAAARAVVGRQPRDGLYVFPIPNRFQPDNLRRTVKRIRKLSGVEHFHLHLCRHHAMTSMLAAGVDIQTAAEILGHTRWSTSLLYAHTSPERKMKAVEAIAVDTPTGHRPADAPAQVEEK